MEAWSNFFLGQLGAAAALTGLLFVSISVNQARILSLGRTADRGLETLGLLLLVLVVTSLVLIPGQPLRLLGAEILAVTAITFAAMLHLQTRYLGDLSEPVLRRALVQAWTNRAAVGLILATGLWLGWRGDIVAIYLLALGILLTFVAVAASAWVLLIEINR